MSASAVALIHSPLAGPATWSGVAREFEAAGISVSVPDLREAVEHRGSAADIIASAAAQLPDAETVLVGHSAAGPLLPAISRASSRLIAGFVFVDAHLPPAAGDVHLATDEYVELIAPLAVDGILPRWSEWWKTAMQRLVPDQALRTTLSADMPRLPLSYFRGVVTAPAGWADGPCGYVRLSEAFEQVAAEAERRAWPVVRRARGHLDLAVDPIGVAGAIRSVVPLDVAS